MSEITNHDLDVRLSILEHSMYTLSQSIADRNQKIDELLELKHKGLGALGLVGLIFTSGLIFSLSILVSWIKH